MTVFGVAIAVRRVPPTSTCCAILLLGLLGQHFERARSPRLLRSVNLPQHLEQRPEVPLVSKHVLALAFEVLGTQAAEHSRVDLDEAYLGCVRHGRFFIGLIGIEESFFSKDVASADHIAHPLPILILDGNHECTVQHEVYLVDLVALREQSLPFVHLDHLGVFDHEFVGVEADLG